MQHIIYSIYCIIYCIYDQLLTLGSQFDNQYAINSTKKYFDIIKNDDLSSLYQEIYRKIIAQEGFLVASLTLTVIIKNH